MLWQVITVIVGIVAIFAVFVSVSEVGKMNKQTPHLLRMEITIMGTICFWAAAKTVFNSWVYGPYDVVHIVYVAVYTVTLTMGMSHGQPPDSGHVPH